MVRPAVEEAVGALVGAPVGEDEVDGLEGHALGHGPIMGFDDIYINAHLLAAVRGSVGTMPYKMSGNLLVKLPRAKEAAGFYRDVLGLDVHEETEGATGFLTNDHYLYFAEAEAPASVFEFLVPDVEEARRELEARGCQVVVWKGKGDDCYMRDPFGNVFNLWEDPEAFLG